MSENKETTVKSYRKIFESKHQEEPLDQVCNFFNCNGEMGMDNFSCPNGSISLFYFYFVTNQ